MSGSSRDIESHDSSSSRLTAKRAHRKSRGGCRSCKSRRVKCDEAKPLCSQCARHYEGLTACEYDDPTPTTRERSIAGFRRSTRGGTERGASATPGSYQSSTSSQNQLSISTTTDPFDQLPPPPSLASQDDLLQYYKTRLIYKCFPFFNAPSLFEAWWSIMSPDPLLLRIALSTTAVQLERKVGRTELYNSSELMFDCMRLLQERLDDDSQAVSDQTLVAVTQLIALENDTGNVKTVRIHSQALQNMVTLRGGLDMVSRSSPIAAALIFWTTMVASSEPSRLPFRFQLTNRRTPRRQNSDPSQLELTRLGVDASLAELMVDVSDLQSQLRNATAMANTQIALTTTIELCCILQSLITFESRNRSNFALTESVCQSAALYTFKSTQASYPAPTLFFSSCIHGLKTSITHALEYFAPGQDCSLLAWTVYIGCVASAHLPEHQWFIHHLAFLLDDMDIGSSEELEEKISYVVAFATVSDVALSEIWKEVEVHLSTD